MDDELKQLIHDYLESVSFFKHVHNGIDFPVVDKTANGLGAATYARMYLNASQTLSSGSPVALDTASFSSGITVDTANNQMVIVTAGLYQVTGSINWTTPAASKSAYAELFISGSAASYNQAQSSGTTPLTVQVTDLMSLSVGDTIKLNGQFNFANGALNNTSAFTFLFAHKL